MAGFLFSAYFIIHFSLAKGGSEFCLELLL